MHRIIYSEKELKKYFDRIMKPLNPLEVFFVSLSARNKYLTKQEREELQLGRTEMFERRLVRYYDWNRFLRTIRKFETNEGSYTTKNNSNIPHKCIVCYININPSNTLKVFKEFNSNMNDYMYELANCGLDKSRDSENIMNRINKMDNLMMTCYQKNRGTKHWIDVDFDIQPEDYCYYLDKFTHVLKENKVKYFIINTKSGFHVLLERDTIKFDFTKHIEALNKKAKSLDGEVVLNKNAMVPLPGTLQAGFEVKFLEE